MARLVAFYSRADENYFGGALRQIPVGNTERLAGTDRKVANTCKGATVSHGLAVQGSAVDRAQTQLQSWI